MATIKGFIFGHYDSRGGTSFIVAENHQQALDYYRRKVFFLDDSDLKEVPDILEDDYICEAEIEGLENVPHGEDLELEGRVLQRGQEGAVLEPGDFGHLLFQPVTGDGNLPNGYWHPVWDDDAFSFAIYEATKNTV